MTIITDLPMQARWTPLKTNRIKQEKEIKEMTKGQPIVAFDTNKMRIFDFGRDGETPEKLLNRANEFRSGIIDNWIKNCNHHPCQESENYLREAEAVNYAVTTLGEFAQAEREHYLNQPIKQITKQEFDYMLDALPPLKWVTIDGCTMFCCAEMLTGPYTKQYAKFGNRYLTKIVDINDSETWIHNKFKAADE
jgi:hypothetical protein